MAAPAGRAWDEEIAEAMAELGLEDMSINFPPWHNPWLKDGRTWAMHRGGQEVLSWTDCIMVTDSCLF